jgi:hypothetical protein
MLSNTTRARSVAYGHNMLGVVQRETFKVQKPTPLMDNIYFPFLMYIPAIIHFEIHTGTSNIYRTIAYVGISDFWGNKLFMRRSYSERTSYCILNLALRVGSLFGFHCIQTRGFSLNVHTVFIHAPIISWLFWSEQPHAGVCLQTCKHVGLSCSSAYDSCMALHSLYIL